MFDFNDAQQQMAPQGELIPDGVFSRVKLTIRPGGTNGAVPMDAKLLKASDKSDALMLNCEMTLMDGPYARRKFWQNFTVAGGKRNEKGESIGWNISKSSFRAMINSAVGLDPKDESPAARDKRKLEGLRQLDGMVLAARIMVEPEERRQRRGQQPDRQCRAAGRAGVWATSWPGSRCRRDPVNAVQRKPRAGARQR